VEGDDAAVREAVSVLQAGGIIAIKGIGGYHLACDARRAEAVRALRVRALDSRAVAAVQTGLKSDAAMAPETRELLEVLIALSLWLAFVAALAWSALHSLISHYREHGRSQTLKPRRPS
jgi:hypothetical protein